MKRKAVLLPLLALLMAAVLFTPVLSAAADGETYIAYVKETDMIRINLRAKPTAASQRLGSFPGGTEVEVLSVKNGWAHVIIRGIEGYMHTNFLEGDLPEEEEEAVPVQPIQPTPRVWPSPGRAISGPMTLYVWTGNPGKLHLREHASQEARSLGLYPNGTPVYAVQMSSGWSYVTVNGLRGYMMTRYLTAVVPPDPQPEPQPVPVPAGSAVVRHPNNTFVYLRSSRTTEDLSNVLAKVPSGSTVEVYEQDRWYSLVGYNGIVGYMVTQYLYGPGTVNPVPPASSVPAVTPSVAIGTAVVRNPNSDFVYMRSSRSSDSRSNVIMEVVNGTEVEVLETDRWWSRIRYLEQEGYMVTHYLQNE